MKKLIIISAVLAIVISFIFTTDNIPSLVALNDNNVEKLKGITESALYEKWGKPHSTLSGMYGDIWLIDDENMVVVYYDGMQNSKVMDAHITKIQKNNERVYIYRESEDNIIKPSFILKADGTFSMTFSALSSYIGIGKYELNGETLSLYTDDGEFEYHFAVLDDGFAFDAEKSSDMTWFTEIPDGALFY